MPRSGLARTCPLGCRTCCSPRREIRRARLRFGLLAGASRPAHLPGVLPADAAQLAAEQLHRGAAEPVGARSSSTAPRPAGASRRACVSPDVVDSGGQGRRGGPGRPAGRGDADLRGQRRAGRRGRVRGRAGPAGPAHQADRGAPAHRAGEGVASSEDKGKGFAIGDTVTTAAGDSPVTIVGLTEQSQFSVQPTLFVTFDTYTTLRKAANPDATVGSPLGGGGDPGRRREPAGGGRLHQRRGPRRRGPDPIATRWPTLPGSRRCSRRSPSCWRWPSRWSRW